MSSDNTPSPPEQPQPQAPQTSGETQSPAPPAQRPQPGPPRPGTPRPGGSTRPFPQGNKPFPKGDRPKNPGGMPESLDRREFGAGKPNNRELDKLIEDEMAQAMTGFSVESTIVNAETNQKARTPGTPAPGGKKKGRIVGIHGKDVFVDVPGGRSQGVLPIQQFEDKKPVVLYDIQERRIYPCPYADFLQDLCEKS